MMGLNKYLYQSDKLAATQDWNADTRKEEVMTYTEALKALEQGKAVRHPTLVYTKHIKVDSRGRLEALSDKDETHSMQTLPFIASGWVVVDI